jgi:hypothetical protein
VVRRQGEGEREKREGERGKKVKRGEEKHARATETADDLTRDSRGLLTVND